MSQEMYVTWIYFFFKENKGIWSPEWSMVPPRVQVWWWRCGRVMLATQVRNIRGGKVYEASGLPQWRPKAAAECGSSGRRRAPQAVGQRQRPGGGVGWVEEDLAAFPRSLGSLDFPIKGSHLLKKSLGYQHPEGFTEKVKASRTSLLH